MIYLIWWPRKYNLICQPCCFDDTPEEKEINTMALHYYLLKIFDLTDTVSDLNFVFWWKIQSFCIIMHVYEHNSIMISK